MIRLRSLILIFMDSQTKKLKKFSDSVRDADPLLRLLLSTIFISTIPIKWSKTTRPIKNVVSGLKRKKRREPRGQLKPAKVSKKKIRTLMTEKALKVKTERKSEKGIWKERVMEMVLTVNLVKQPKVKTLKEQKVLRPEKTVKNKLMMVKWGVKAMKALEKEDLMRAGTWKMQKMRWMVAWRELNKVHLKLL